MTLNIFSNTFNLIIERLNASWLLAFNAPAAVPLCSCGHVCDVLWSCEMFVHHTRSSVLNPNLCVTRSYVAHSHLRWMQLVCVWRRAPSMFNVCVSYIEKRCGMYLWYVELYHTIHKIYVRKMSNITRVTDVTLALNRGCIFAITDEVSFSFAWRRPRGE